MPDVWVLSAWQLSGDGSKVPAVVADYPSPLGWSDMNSQIDADILAGLNQSVVVGQLTDPQAAALQLDANYVVLSVGNPALASAYAPQQVTALDAAVSAALSSDVAAWALLNTAAPEVVVDRLVEANTRPVWRAGLAVQVGEVYHYAGNLFEVIQTHTSQSDWTPDIVPALFKRFYEPLDDPWPWAQPAGGHDAYPLNARVLHAGYTYVSLISANVWEPGAAGSEALWSCENCPPPVETWATGVLYHVNDQVTHLGTLYRCLQQHTSIASWSPTSPGILGVLWALV